MMRIKAVRYLVVPILVAVGATFFLLGPPLEEPGCACAPPPSLEEVQRLTALAEKGDYEESILATGDVWFAYEMRGEDAQAEIWARKVIDIGSPRALYHMANDLIWDVQDQPDRKAKIAKIEEALVLLEKAYPNRSMFDALGRIVFAETLRTSRAVLAVLRDGREEWQAKARSGDANAAFSLGAYYFYGEFDQEKRSYWENMGAKLGDLQLAQGEACCWRKTREDLLEGKRLIQGARDNRAAIAAIHDAWIRSVLLEELDSTELQIDRRLEALTSN